MASSHPFDRTIASNTCLYCPQLVTPANLGTLVCESKCPVAASDDSKIQLAAPPYQTADRLLCPSMHLLETRPAHCAQPAVSSDDLGHDVFFASRLHTGLAPTQSPLVATVYPGPEIPGILRLPPGWVTRPRQFVGTWQLRGMSNPLHPLSVYSS